jgi:hypothetical protein
MWKNEALYIDKYTGHQQLVYVACENSQYVVHKKNVLDANSQSTILLRTPYRTRLWCVPEHYPELVTDYPPPSERQLQQILREYPMGCNVNTLRIALINLPTMAPRYTRVMAHYAAHQPNMQVTYSDYTGLIAALESLRDTMYAEPVDTLEDIEL